MKFIFKILAGYILLLLISPSLVGCKSIEKSIEKRQQKKATRFFNEHPDKAAEYLVKHFPSRDSLAIDSIRKANNKNYVTDIDNLKELIFSIDSFIKDGTVFPENNLQDTAIQKLILRQLASTKETITLLKNKITALQSSYKPCLPDTVFATRFTVDGALVEYNTALKENINLLTIENVKIAGDKKKLQWKFIAACILALLLVVFITILIKGKKIAPWQVLK